MNRKQFAALLLTCAAFAGASSASAATEAEKAKAQELVDTVCAACHAADGNSGISLYPRIAGQHPEYMFKQLVDIRDGKRSWGNAGMMQPMVEGITDNEFKVIVDLMNKQVAKPGEADPKKDIQLGRLIYRGGVASNNTPACMSCHGPDGAGMPSANVLSNYPRLTGQHSDYVLEQMQAFKDGSRVSNNNIMNDIAKKLNDEQLDAVSNYIQGLH